MSPRHLHLTTGLHRYPRSRQRLAGVTPNVHVDFGSLIIVSIPEASPYWEYCVWILRHYSSQINGTHLLSSLAPLEARIGMDAGKFDSRNADIKFQSTDGVVFNLHTALLQAHTGGFPGPEFSAQGEVVQLSEPANVLALLFDLIYPKRHLDLSETEPETVFALAEAVEKYEVFSAMFVCNARLSAYLPKYPERIFVYAVKHGYPKLMDKAAPLLHRSLSISVMEELPACYSLPWYRYQRSWSRVFNEARKDATRLPLLPKIESGERGYKTCHSVPAAVCSVCQNSMFLWITHLEEINTVSSLCATLNGTPPYDCCQHSSGSISGATYADGQCSTAVTSEYSCNHLLNLTRSIRYQIRLIPHFSEFINGRSMTLRE